MLYTHFAPLGANRWAVLSSSIQVAEVAISQDGTTLTAPAPLTHTELDAIHTFMHSIEAAPYALKLR